MKLLELMEIALDDYRNGMLPDLPEVYRVPDDFIAVIKEYSNKYTGPSLFSHDYKYDEDLGSSLVYFSQAITGAGEQSKWAAQLRKRTNGLDLIDVRLPKFSAGAYELANKRPDILIVVDLFLAAKSRFVLVDLTKPPSYGVAAELSYAREAHVPIIGVVDKDTLISIFLQPLLSGTVNYKEIKTTGLPILGKTGDWIRNIARRNFVENLPFRVGDVVRVPPAKTKTLVTRVNKTTVKVLSHENQLLKYGEVELVKKASAPLKEIRVKK